MSVFRPPPRPFVGGRQPLAKRTLPVALIPANPAPSNPPFANKRNAAVQAAVVQAWVPVPRRFVGGEQPNAGTLIAAVTQQAAPQSASPGVGTLTITGFAPTISQPQAVNAGVGSLTLTGFAPTVSQPQAATAGAGSMTLTGFAPTVTQDVQVQPGAGSLTITGYSPSVAQTVSQSVEPGAGPLTIQGYPPTVTQTGVEEQQQLGGVPHWWRARPKRDEEPAEEPVLVLEVEPEAPQEVRHDFADRLRRVAEELRVERMRRQEAERRVGQAREIKALQDAEEAIRKARRRKVLLLLLDS